MAGDEEVLVVGAYVRMFIEIEVPIPDGFDATDQAAIRSLWDEHVDYNQSERLEVSIDFDKVQALYEFDRDV